MIPKVVASEIGEGQTEGSNIFGVLDAISYLESEPKRMGRRTREGESPVGEA